MRSRVAKPTSPTDSEIIEEVLLGKTESFGVLFDRYAKRIFGYLWHFTNRKEDCEDFLQETFYKAYVNLKHCRERERFSSWLFSIAHNAAVSASKKLSASYQRELPLEKFLAIHDPASPEDLNVELVRQENSERVRKALSEMPAKYREVVTLFYYNDMSLKEISDILAIPVNTAKTRLHRSRLYLGEKLKEADANPAVVISLAKSSTEYH